MVFYNRMLMTRILRLREHEVFRAIIQAVTRRLPTSAARVQSQIRSRAVFVGRSATGADFPEYFGFTTKCTIIVSHWG
jgi:hypothetical protein